MALHGWWRLNHNYYWLAVVCLLLVACGVPVAEFDSGPVAEVDTIEGETAVVTHVIDGDTIDVEMNGQEFRVRYIGVDTPERETFYYAEATEANRQMVAGQTVTMVKDVSETDRNGRLLRYIYLDDGTFVNAELVQQGYAVMVTFPPDVEYQELFQELEREARQAGRGLWDSGDGETAVCSCSKNRYNCADFSTQSKAQACFEFCLDEVGEDIHRLDGGGDGLVCESLP